MEKSKLIYAIHSSGVTLDLLNGLFEEYIPEAQVYNIVDDSLLAGLYVHGAPTPKMLDRFCAYAVLAEQAGADILFSQCSSFGGGVDIARNLINIPFLKIDRPMMEEAVARGSKIAVVATTVSTMKPSCALLRECAGEAKKRVEIVEVAYPEALKILMEEKDPVKHDNVILDLLAGLPPDIDCAVLAQGSMHRMKDKLGRVKLPVLTSPELGVRAARKALGLA